ncbi:MAG: DUF3098 domain-containing protein [Saprospiraceae bacterium]|nr:DUF3098 domain-containing protein [Lewinella sp.]
MSKQRPPKKKVVVTTSSNKVSVKPTVSKTRTSSAQQPATPLMFNRQHYILMGAGAALVILGIILMSGGAMENPNEWKPEVIYSFRRTVLAPVVILGGLVVEIYAIFK